MKKFICIISFSILFCLLLFAGVYATNNNVIEAIIVNYPIIVNGDPIETDLPVISIFDKTYLPLRELCNILQINIDWNNENHCVEITNSQDTFDLGITTKDGWITNQTIDMEISLETAIELADDVYRHLFGDEYLKNTQVYASDKYDKNYHVVHRAENAGSTGGGYDVYVRKSDGKIVKIELSE